MANLAPLVPLLVDLFSKKRSPTPATPPSGEQIRRDADQVSAIDQEQELEIEDLKDAVRDLRRANVALANQLKRALDRIEDLEGTEE